MMPGIGFTEMILLAVVAIVVIGPKDLPLMMRKFGKFTGKMRALAFEFQQGIDELGRQAELEELRKEVAELKKNTGLEDLRDDLNKDRAEMEASAREQLPSPGEAAPGTPPPASQLSPEQMEESRLLSESANMPSLEPTPSAADLADAMPEARHYDYPGASEEDAPPAEQTAAPAKQETPA
ncbi:MAG TPA: Sec-independent protein translocase protein TatB [Hyphomonadaceae bacterium]|nr:Sec-independent protein translocase protein TatB [Hyphomonadaceae bacterium]